VLADVERRKSELTERETELSDLERRVAAREEEAAQQQASIEERDAALRERETALERDAREQARHYLLEARKRVEEALGVARAAVTEATAKEARRLVEQGIADEAKELERLAERGWRVTKEGQRDRGMEGPKDDPHVLTSSRSPVSTSHRGGNQGVDITPRTGVSEVDLRGMMAEDAREATMRAVDDAILADLPIVRIIHGKGTGALRRVVDEVLRADRRVTAHKLAPPREGGTGVTIAELG
jgi:DNA mismatch repair protein MutS2